MAEIGQWHVNNVCDLNMHEEKGLNALTKDHTMKVHHKSRKNEVRVGKKVEDLIQPAKHLPIIHVFKKHDNKEKHNDNGNRFNIFIDNTVIEQKDEE